MASHRTIRWSQLQFETPCRRPWLVSGECFLIAILARLSLGFYDLRYPPVCVPHAGDLSTNNLGLKYQRDEIHPVPECGFVGLSQHSHSEEVLTHHDGRNDGNATEWRIWITAACAKKTYA